MNYSSMLSSTAILASLMPRKPSLFLRDACTTRSAAGLLFPKTKKNGPIFAFDSGESELRVRIKDQGKGFDWRQYLEIDPERATHPHGRGIATSKLMSFSSVSYTGCGNEAVCTVALAG